MKLLPSVYCFIRADLPLHQQIVQVGHAALNSGAAFQITEPHNLIVFSVRDEEELLFMADKLDLFAGLKYTMFYEDESISPPGHTAICTSLVDKEDISKFKKFRLWGK